MSGFPGSNAAGEVFATFKIDTTGADAALSSVESKAKAAGGAVERAGDSSSNAFKKSTGAILGTAAAVGAVIAALDKALAAVGEFNAAPENLANSYRDIDKSASGITDQFNNASADFDKLAKQAREFGEDQIRALEAQRQELSAANLLRRGYAELSGVVSEEEGKINQILARRVELEQAVGRAREEAFTKAVADRQRKDNAAEQVRQADALNELEKELQQFRRDGLTEQQRLVEDLTTKIEDAKKLAKESADPQIKRAFEQYADAFAKQLDKSLKDVVDKAAKEFAKKVTKEFEGTFDQSALNAFGASIESQLAALRADIRLASRGVP